MDKIAVTGSFDPPTLGHMDLIGHALEMAETAYVVLLINPDRKPYYTVERRLEMLKAATEKWGERVKVFYYDALAIDFCRENNIQYIVRGVRTSADFGYEEEMARWNRENGGVYTVIFPAKRLVSATEVRRGKENGEDISNLVPVEIMPML